MEAASITETASAPPPARKAGDILNAYALPLMLVLVLVAQFIHEPTNTLDDLKTGLSNGTIWALIALGYTLVYGIIELINFAHGDLFMIGSFASVGLWGTLGLGLATGTLGLIGGLLVTLVVAMVACGTLNVLIERVGYRPLRAAPRLAPLITAVGFSFILQNVGLLWRGGSSQGVSDLIHSQHKLLSIGGVSVGNGDVLAVATTVPLVILLTTFVAQTRFGRAMRAT